MGRRVGWIGCRGVRRVSLKGQGGDCGGAQRDKDPGDLAGDLGRPLRGAGKVGETKLPVGPAGQRHRKRAQASAWGKDSAPTSGAGESATPSGHARRRLSASGREAERSRRGGTGPGERGRGSRPGWAACWEGKGSWAREKGLGWVFLGRALGIAWLTGFGFLSISISLLF